MNESRFIIRHLNDESKDLRFQMIVDEEGQKVEWNGNFPETLKCNLETDFDMLKTYPLVCLNLALN